MSVIIKASSNLTLFCTRGPLQCTHVVCRALLASLKGLLNCQAIDRDVDIKLCELDIWFFKTDLDSTQL